MSNFPIGVYADMVELKSRSSHELLSAIAKSEDGDSNESIAEPILMA